MVFDASDPRELQVRSPLAYAASLESPARLYYSTVAAPLLGAATRRLVEVARGRGADVAAVNVPGSHFSHVAPAMARSLAFFQRSLGPAAARRLVPRTVPAPEPSLVGRTTFRLRGHPDAKRVTVAGSFNGWDSQHLLCGRAGDAWICRIDLPPGRYFYQFVIDDGEWILDPDNPARGDNGEGGTASVLVVRER